MSITLASKLQSMSLNEEDPCTSFLKSLEVDSIYALWSIDNPEKVEDLKERQRKDGDYRPKKSMLIKAISSAVDIAAAKSLVERLTHPQLAAVAEGVPIQHKQSYVREDGSKKKVPVGVYEKRLTEVMTKDGMTMKTFMTQYHRKNKTLIIELLDTFELKYEDDDDLIGVLCAHITWMGIHSYLQSIPLRTLQEVAVIQKLTKQPGTSRDRIVDGLISGKLPKKRDVEPEQIVSLKSIGPKKSISKSDFFGMWQHYTLAELVQYCKKNGVKTSGNKTQVIDRLIQWREADKENKSKFETKEADSARAKKAKKTMAQNKKEEEKKKAEQSKSEKSSRKSNKMEVDSDEDDKKKVKESGKPKRKSKVESDTEDEVVEEKKPKESSKSKTKSKVESDAEEDVVEEKKPKESSKAKKNSKVESDAEDESVEEEKSTKATDKVVNKKATSTKSNTSKDDITKKSNKGKDKVADEKESPNVKETATTKKPKETVAKVDTKAESKVAEEKSKANGNKTTKEKVVAPEVKTKEKEVVSKASKVTSPKPVVEKTAPVKEPEEDSEEESDEKTDAELLDVAEIEDDESAKIIDNPHHYNLETLKRFCAFVGIEKDGQEKYTREDYFELINNTVLDRSNLKKYSTSVLAAYAEEELLEVKGKSRKAIVEMLTQFFADKDKAEGVEAEEDGEEAEEDGEDAEEDGEDAEEDDEAEEDN